MPSKLDNANDLKAFLKESAGLFAEAHAACAAAVVREEWFSSASYSPLPFHFARSRLERGRLLAGKPTKGEHRSPILHGLDAEGRVVVYTRFDANLKPTARGCVAREGEATIVREKAGAAAYAARIEAGAAGLARTWAWVSKYGGAIGTLEEREPGAILEERVFDFLGKTESRLVDTVERDTHGEAIRVRRTLPSGDSRVLWEAKRDAAPVDASAALSRWFDENRGRIVAGVDGPVGAFLLAYGESSAVLCAVSKSDLEAHAVRTDALDELLNPAEYECPEHDIPLPEGVDARARRELLLSLARHIRAVASQGVKAGGGPVVSVSDFEMSELEASLAALHGGALPKLGKSKPRTAASRTGSGKAKRGPRSS